MNQPSAEISNGKSYQINKIHTIRNDINSKMRSCRRNIDRTTKKNRIWLMCQQQQRQLAKEIVMVRNVAKKTKTNDKNKQTNKQIQIIIAIIIIHHIHDSFIRTTYFIVDETPMGEADKQICVSKITHINHTRWRKRPFTLPFSHHQNSIRDFSVRFVCSFFSFSFRYFLVDKLQHAQNMLKWCGFFGYFTFPFREGIFWNEKTNSKVEENTLL